VKKTTIAKLDAYLWKRDPDDWYVEPSWVCDSLFAAEEFEGTICDPACGLGRVLDAAKRAGHTTFGIDIKDRGASQNHRFKISDFFGLKMDCPNIVSNPPYKYDDAFLEHAIARAEKKTALLLRAPWANGAARSRRLAQLPLKRVLMVTPRPSMPPGAVIRALKGKDPSGGRVDYAWFIFERGFTGQPTFGWARRPAKEKK